MGEPLGSGMQDLAGAPPAASSPSTGSSGGGGIWGRIVRLRHRDECEDGNSDGGADARAAPAAQRVDAVANPPAVTKGETPLTGQRISINSWAASFLNRRSGIDAELAQACSTPSDAGAVGSTRTALLSERSSDTQAELWRTGVRKTSSSSGPQLLPTTTSESEVVNRKRSSYLHPTDGGGSGAEPIPSRVMERSMQRKSTRVAGRRTRKSVATRKSVVVKANRMDPSAFGIESSPVEEAWDIVKSMLEVPGRTEKETGQLDTLFDILSDMVGEEDLKRTNMMDDLNNAGLDQQTRDFLMTFTGSVALTRERDRKTLYQITRGIVIAQRFAQKPVIRPSQRDNIAWAPGESLRACLNNINSWNEFDVFSCTGFSEERPIRAITLEVLQHHNLMCHFDISMGKMLNFLNDLEGSYLDNPYHNRMHAADVLQGLHVLINPKKMLLSELHKLAATIAAVGHDAGHLGVTNNYRVAMCDEDAITYNDLSVNENMHSALTFRFLRKEGSDFLVNLTKEQYLVVRKVIVDSILATDMAQHAEKMCKMNRLVDEFTGDFTRWDAPELAIEWFLHISDISNCTRPNSVATRWTSRVLKEFFAQGDDERDMGMPISPLCDRKIVSEPESQMGFINFIIKPAFEILSECLDVDIQIQNMDRYFAYNSAKAANAKDRAAKEKQTAEDVVVENNIPSQNTAIVPKLDTGIPDKSTRTRPSLSMAVPVTETRTELQCHIQPASSTSLPPPPRIKTHDRESDEDDQSRNSGRVRFAPRLKE